MSRGSVLRLPLWLAFGMALGLALGPLADSLRLAVLPRTAWAAAGPTAYRYPTAASGTFTVANGNVYNDSAACTGANTLADTSKNTSVTQSETYSAFNFTAADVPANSTINGVTVTLAASEANPGGDTLNVQLVDGVTLLGTAKTTSPTLTSTETLYTLGGAADPWGASLTQALVISAIFGVKVTNNSAVGGGAKTVSLYCLNVSVAYNPPANIQVADGVAPDGTGIAQGYGASVSGSLAAKFTQNTQTIYAGYIDVTNPTNLPYGNFDTGYTLANAPSPAPAPGSASDILNSALKVQVDATTNTSTACDTDLSDGNSNASAVVPAGTAWVGTLIGTPRAAINTNGASEKLCFYLSITGALDTIAGGSLQYNLTFTAI